MVYEQVLREGNEDDIRRFIRVDDLIDMWDELVLPRHVRRAWVDWQSSIGVFRCLADTSPTCIAELVAGLPQARSFVLAGAGGLLGEGNGRLGRRVISTTSRFPERRKP